MKKITTLTLLFCIALNAFAQQEIPMFFDKDLMLSTDNSSLIAYSPDGSKIATEYSKGKIAIWDATTGKIITKLAGHGNIAIDGIVFSPNGRQLVSFADDDTTIKIWDTASGALVRNISQAGVDRISFSPDGSRIVGAYSILTWGVGTDYGIKIWNTANGSVIRTIDILTYTTSITYSPDGRQLLATTNEGIRIWDSGNGQIIRTIDSVRYEEAIYSPNGRYMAAYKRQTGIRIFNAETGQEALSIPLQQVTRTYCAYSPDGRQLLVNTRDDNRNTVIKIFDPETGRELRSFSNGDRAVAFSPDGKRILTTSTSFTLKIDDKNYGASYATLLDATTGKVTGTIGYGPLNVGARAYADLQIARFLGDIAAVNRHEAVLQYITGRGNATRAEIEKFYRDNVRSLIAAVVDEEFNKVWTPFLDRVPNVTLARNPKNGQYTLRYWKPGTGDMIITTNSLDLLLSEMRNGTNRADFTPAGLDAVRSMADVIPAVYYEKNNLRILSLVMDRIVNFFQTPNQANYNLVKSIYIDFNNEAANSPDSILFKAEWNSLRNTLRNLPYNLTEKIESEVTRR